MRVEDIKCCCVNQEGECVKDNEMCPVYIECHKLMALLRDRDTKPNCLNEILEGEY